MIPMDGENGESPIRRIMDPELIQQLPFSRQTGPLQDTVDRLKIQYKTRWLEMPSTCPEFTRSYGRRERKRIEKETTAFVEDMLRFPEEKINTADPINPEINRAIDRAEVYAEKLSSLMGHVMDEAYVKGCLKSAHRFIEKIKDFDPDMIPDDIYQAMRNVWIMNSLQVYMNLNIVCSGPMFAYSMFYPYTDNLMDDDAIAPGEKRRVNLIIRQLLEGRGNPADLDGAGKLAGLLELIETEFPRRQFPGVYQSLLAIFNAQLRSLAQQRAHSLSALEILDISFEKGGTSVLADGYLMKGELTSGQADFCFGYGAFLQLADDIQDVTIDRRKGHMTLFSRDAGRSPLDDLANRLFHFIPAVTASHLPDPSMKNLKNMINQNTSFLVMEAIGRNGKFFSRDYLKKIEPHFPFSFKYLEKLRKKIEKRFQKYEKRASNLDTISAILLTVHSRMK